MILSAMWSPLVLVHIPKTGGTSVRTAVEQALPIERILRVYRLHTTRSQALVALQNYAAGRDPNFIPPDFIVGHFGSDFAQLAGIPQARLFTVLRDPYKRSVSLWRHEVRNFPNSLFGVQARQLSFVEFFEARLSPIYENSQARMIVGSIEQEILWKLTGDDNNLLERAKAKMEADFSFIGLTEDLTATFAWVGEQLGLTLQTVRTNVDDGPRDDLLTDPANRKVIERFFGVDIALYQWASSGRRAL